MSSLYGYFLLFGLVLLVLYYKLLCHKQKVQESYVKEGNLPPFIAERSNFAFFVKAICIFCAWIFLTIALTKLSTAKSSIEKEEVESSTFPKVDEVAFILDVSSSMGATDTQDGISRLARAKELIETMVESLGGINASLVAFAGTAKQVVPDTLDYLYFRVLLDSELLNDVGEAGTNLLAMVDAVKAKYVNSPYKKNVRIVLLTDGEDTGFLDMNRESKKQAEDVLLQHIQETKSSRLEWEVIGLGTTEGALVPDVLFEGQPVISAMQKELLQRMAEAGGGHFYQEKNRAALEISDAILADVAASHESSEHTVSSYAPRAPLDVMLLVSGALIVLLFSQVVPETKRKTATLLLLFAATSLHADSKIDRGIEFADAGREDLALGEFSKMLQGEIAPVERATLLYDISVLLARQNRYWDALIALNQIDDTLYQSVEKSSPQLAVQIAYNGAVYALDYVKLELSRLANGEKYSDELLQHITEGIEFAKSSLTKMPQSLDFQKLEIEEGIRNSEEAVRFYSSLVSLHSLDKGALLDTLGSMLLELFSHLVDIDTAEGLTAENSALYMQKYRKEKVERILFCLMRVDSFLQAPAKKDVFMMHDFLRKELLELRGELLDVFDKKNLQGALHILYRLSSLVLLLQEEVENRDITFILEERVDIATEHSLQNKLYSFWGEEYSFWQHFSRRYLERKKGLSDPFTAKLIESLESRLETSQPLIHYWKILSQPEDTTFQELATLLHAREDIQIAHIVDPLRDRLKALDIPRAENELAEMNPPYFDHVLISWFYVNPQKALNFLLSLLSDEIAALQTNPTFDRSIASADYKLLLHILSLFVKKGCLADVQSDLQKNEPWFSQKERRDIDFFRMSLELGWLKEILTNEREDLKGITEAVDFGVDLQKKTMSLLRYSQEKGFSDDLALLARMQEKVIQEVATSLATLPTKGPKIKKVISLIDDAKDMVLEETKELSSMQKVLDDLEEASKILHSLQSESDKSKNNEEQASKELTQQSLKLNPDLSIRLLQQMEQQDKSLKTQNIPQVTGKRPW